MRFTKLYTVILASIFLTLGLAACGSNENATDNGAKTKSKEEVVEEKIVNVYTARHYEADEEVFKNFTEETGIQVNVVKGEAEELIERLKREGESTEADLFITVDGGILA
ncbi:MAG: Fe(3+) transporter substrate-binding protein, partial [Neobacillus sp.]|nr:Fe(3+) transporter substrate-binding protein [Neobacillus sp.]